MSKKEKGNGKFFAALVIFSLVGQIAWVVENMYFNVFIYKMFGASTAILCAFLVLLFRVMKKKTKPQ